jgi:cobalt-precorrin 5A hydrolase
MPSSTTAVYALTPQGAELGRTLARALAGDLYLPARMAEGAEALGFESFTELVPDTFHRYGRHVFVCAAGIVVRAVGPLLASKFTDPAVVVLDQKGRHAVSLVSGHLGGANDLAREVAALTGGEAVITTATDTAGLPALDILARERNLVMENPGAVKTVAGALLAGDRVRLFDPENRLGLLDAASPWAGLFIPMEDSCWESDQESGQGWGEPGIVVTWRTVETAAATLVLRPRCLVVGVGCRRGTPAADIWGFIRENFMECGLAMASIHALASIEAKRDEAGLLEAAGTLGVELEFVSAEALRGVPVPNPSPMPLRHVGVESVSEAAALVVAGTDTLLVEKQVGPGVTCAVALSNKTDC